MFSAARKNKIELQKADREPFDVKFNRGLNTAKEKMGTDEKLSRDHVMCS
jgi:hypothetical protein